MNSKAESLQQAAAKQPLIINPIETGMNVVTKQEYTDLAKYVFGNIVDVLSKSYGPYGSMSLINRSGYRFSTKDGWRILLYTKFDTNPYYQAIRQMIFDVCEQMNDRVGDGTTTVILIANRIYQALLDSEVDLDDQDLPPRDIFKAFDDIVSRVTEELRKYSRSFSQDDVKQVASIATNNDEVITDCLCRLYARDPNADIQIMESPKLGVSIEEIEGLKIPLNLMDLIYVNNKIEKCCDVENAVYLVFNHKVADNAMGGIILACENYARARSMRLVVVAPAYEESMIVSFWLKRTADEFRATNTNVTILTMYKPTILGTAGASDLAVLLDTAPIDGRMVDAIAKHPEGTEVRMVNGRLILSNQAAGQVIVLGRCEQAKLGYESMSFFSGLHPVENLLNAQIESVKSEIAALEDTMSVTEKAASMKIVNLKKRLARLQMKMSVIYYGADSTFDKEMMHDTIEDGVRALESARDSGIIKGSQYDLLNACKSLYAQTPEENVLDRTILRCMAQGIINMLIYDLYGKSKGFRDGFRYHKHLEPEPNPIEPDKMSVRQRERFEKTKEIYEHDLVNLIDLDYISDMQPLNLITLEPDENLIASTETDISALKASIELIKILMAGNQMLMVD